MIPYSRQDITEEETVGITDGMTGFNYPNGLSMKSLFVQMMLERGFLASTSYYAMYAHTKDNCQDYLDAVSKVFAEISRLQKRGKIEESMLGTLSSAGFTRLA